jgi:hypothetical protein
METKEIEGHEPHRIIFESSSQSFSSFFADFIVCNIEGDEHLCEVVKMQLKLIERRPSLLDYF